MPALPGYLNAKNKVGMQNDGYLLCIEFLYDNSDPSPANWLYYRRARHDQDLTLAVDQLGNPGHTVTVTFDGGSPIGDFEEQENTQSQTTTIQLVLPNAARELQSICEFYDLTDMPGRLLWVHPDFLSDGAAVESDFQIIQAAPVRDHGVITVSPFTFDPLNEMLPAEQITTERWPGLAGARAKYLV
jgi:hypothetical protein